MEHNKQNKVEEVGGGIALATMLFTLLALFLFAVPPIFHYYDKWSDYWDNKDISAIPVYDCHPDEPCGSWQSNTNDGPKNQVQMYMDSISNQEAASTPLAHSFWDSTGYKVYLHCDYINLTATGTDCYEKTNHIKQ